MATITLAMQQSSVIIVFCDSAKTALSTIDKLENKWKSIKFPEKFKNTFEKWCLRHSNLEKSLENKI